MNDIRQAYRLLRSEGLGAIIGGAGRELLRRLDPIYQRVKPEYRSYRLGETAAEFDMSRRRLGQHDFVDDIQSEHSIINRVVSVVKEDDVFYDIGANVGIYTCFVGTTLDSGNVVAFEPMPDPFSILERNVEQNQVNAELLRVALSDANKQEKMASQGRTGHRFADESGETVQIDTRRGDDFIAEQDLQPPDVCKIDIEGAEYKALSGMKKTLAEGGCRSVFCEIHRKKIKKIGGSAEAVEDLLRSLGYELEYLGERRENYFVEATLSSGLA